MKRTIPLALAALILTTSLNTVIPMSATTSNCDDVRIIWANGSGANINGTDNNYLDFHDAVQHELMKTSAKFSFYELGTSAHGGHQYPAASVGVRSLDEIWRTALAALSAGESYEYGESALEGALEMREYIKEVLVSCPDTKFVLGGLSQGGQVVSWAIQDIDPENIIYAATFGDPKLYLPEGKYGKNSSACRSIYYDNFSEYRAYVPDCEAYEGILKARNPYQPAGYSGKLGAWCSYHDVMCSSHINFLDLWNDSLAPHGSYGKAYFAYDLYGDAAKIIRKKVVEHIKDKYAIADVDNVVFILDRSRIQNETIPLLENILKSMIFPIYERGGKVAVYFYGDDGTGKLHKACGFDTGDTPECSIDYIYEIVDKRYETYDFEHLEESYQSEYTVELAELYNTMSVTSWQPGADKTMVILSNANYASGFYNGAIVTVNELVELSKGIDPVNIYSFTPQDLVKNYENMTTPTGGKSFDLSTANYATIAGMREVDDTVRSGWNTPDANKYETATISNVKTEILEDNSLKISYDTENTKAVGVFLNEAMVGLAKPNGVMLKDIDYAMQNDLTLIPLPEVGYAGEAIETTIEIYQGEAKPQDIDKKNDAIKTPDCGITKR